MKSIYPFIFILSLVTSGYGQASLEDYLRIAEQSNPGLQAKRTNVEIALQKAAQVGSLPDPTLAVSAFGQMVETRVGQQMARISLTQMFPWFGALKAKRHFAAIQAEAQYAAYLDARNNLWFRVSAAYYPLYQLQQQVQLQTENLKILDTYKALSTTKFQSGKAGLADAIRVDIMMEDIKTELAVLGTKKYSMETAFNKLLNQEPSTPVHLPDSLEEPHHAEVIAADSLLTKNPRLLELDRQIEASAQMEKAAIKDSYPRFGVGFEYIVTAKRPNQTFEDNGKDAYMPSVSLSLPIFRSKYKAAITEAQLNGKAYQQLKTETTNNLITDIENTRFEMEKSMQEIHLFDKQTEQVKLVVRLLLASYSNNETDMEELLRMQQQLLKYKLMKVNSLTDYYVQLARLNYLIANEIND